MSLRWYVVHAYSNFEHRVADALKERIRLQGDVPSPINPPPACRFHTRCWKAQEICRTTEPPLLQLAPGHQAACHFPENQPADKPVAPAPSPDTDHA